MTDSYGIGEHVATVHRCVEEILQSAEVAPERVNQILADIPDDKWRAMISTLRQGGNNV